MLAAAVRRTSRSARMVAVVGATALAGSLFAAVALTQAAKPSKVIHVSGALKDHTQTEGCPTSYCNEGRYISGDLRGTTFQFRNDKLIPTDVPGVTLYTGRQTIYTSRGKIECSSNGVVNSNPGSAGEGVHLCSIDGGTRYYKGATGYLQERFHFHDGSGSGGYKGVIRLR